MKKNLFASLPFTSPHNLSAHRTYLLPRIFEGNVNFARNLAVLLILTFYVPGLASALESVEVSVTDTKGLVAAVLRVNMGEIDTINIVAGKNGETEVVFEEPHENGSNALPVITKPVTINASNITFRRGHGEGVADFRLMEINIPAMELDRKVILNAFSVEDFAAPNNGGAILIKGTTSFSSFRSGTTTGTRYANNHAPGSGGAISIQDDASFSTSGAEFRGNSAGGDGGAVNVTGNATGVLQLCHFQANQADGDGSAINVNTDPSAKTFFGVGVLVWNCTLISGMGASVLVHNPRGSLGMADCEFSGGGEHIRSTGSVKQSGNVYIPNPVQNLLVRQKWQIESACEDFGTDAIVSLGYNISTEDSCALIHPTDLPNTDPLVLVDVNGIPQPQPGSPVIESGPVDFVNNDLPCLYKDLNGLGRPQDFDLDGVFTCDRGPVEVQGGPDIGAPQTSAYAATGRGGEGSFVEILANGLAIISFYTYSLDGTTLAWYMGLGRVVGNSIVIDEMQKVTGGVFGASFDEASIVRTNVGGMSMVFPECDATASPGRLNFTARSDSGLEHLLNAASRLSFVVNCDGTKAANAHRSGAFFSIGRSGEGIFVQWLSDGRVALVFYTFDAAGNPFWTTSDIGNTVVNGNTVTANMLYAQGKTKFGASFDPAEVTMAPWGTITLTYSTDDTINFAHNSVVAGFTPGNHAYVRITQPLGTKTVAQGN